MDNKCNDDNESEGNQPVSQQLGRRMKFQKMKIIKKLKLQKKANKNKTDKNTKQK